MRLPNSKFLFVIVAGTGTLLAAPQLALAHDHGPDWQDGASEAPRPRFDPAAREAWLADCRHSMGPDRRDPRVADECESILSDYYARFYDGSYRQPDPGYAYPGYGYPGYGYPGHAPAYFPGYPPQNGCCTTAPVVMVPVQQPKPECTETIEYVYEDVPVRRKVYKPRVVHDKRVKIVPDKRIKIK